MTQSTVSCFGGYKYGKNAFQKCHCDTFGGGINLNKAIAKSCNSYFSRTYRKIIDKPEMLQLEWTTGANM